MATLVEEDDLRRIVGEEFDRRLILLGIVAADPSEIVEMQKDMAFLRTWRKAMNTGSGRAALTVFTFVLLGLIYATLSALGVPRAFTHIFLPSAPLS